jgi:hypothetical protein
MLDTGVHQASDGHFVVPMLWRQNSKLPDNRQQVERRFTSLTHRLSMDSKLQENYAAFLNGYVSSGYARQLTCDKENQVSDRTWYLPHHCVLNPNKPGKVRVVFDAASEWKGASLNNQLMTGPDLMNGLFSVIQRFRLHPIALVADVKEMFHQVWVSDQDSDSLRFLWKEDLNQPGPPKTYKMLVHIFGAKDSPCCVNFALKKAAEKAEPQVRDTILHNFYVDDMLKSVKDCSSAIALAHQVSKTLVDHGFFLTKWLSSSQEVIDSLPQEQRALKEFNFDLEEIPIQRALGLGWDVNEDCFVFRPVVKNVPMTKRGIIAAVSSIFDPCGFVTPFTFRAKLLIQELWRASLGWDDAVPETLQNKWISWHQELPHISNFRIPRYHGSNSDSRELHIFCDASEAGFAAVAHLRLLDDDTILCSFLASKSHLAPIKGTLTIPKLELQGAVMAVRLFTLLKESIHFNEAVFWTDALTVLRYINNEEKKWKIFVANRISEIREHTEPTQWRYVPSHLNPADDATRGLQVQMLCDSSRWLNGPDFLCQSENHWPVQPQISSVVDHDEELRRPSASTFLTARTLTKTPANVGNLIKVEDYSSWFRLLRHTAWILRAIKNFKASISKTSPVRKKYLSTSELQDAQLALVRVAQYDCFPQELKSLQAQEPLLERSSILSLNPIYDAELDVIRVGGRLRKAPDIVSAKHQLLLPYTHHVTRLIARDMHFKLAHCGPEHLISALRQTFWPVKCRQMVKSVIFSCMDCKRRTVQPRVPLMADLPLPRLNGFTRPFQFTGLDFFGPMTAKRARSRVKRWGCIFTCMTTRAIHLELVDSLSTDDFIMPLRCFVSRRGIPSEIYSDNGTNLRGAERELGDNFKQLDQDKIHDFLLRNNTEWHFITPHAPHFGGVWESLVKSVKKALKAVLKEQVVTESVLRTTLIEVEAIINSRPLTYNSSDANDLTALTPGHFLHGGATYTGNIGKFPPQDVCNRKRWRQTQVLVDHIWKRWLREYLPNLTVRRCWKSEQPNLHPNDLVLMMEENLPRGQWPLGRIVEVLPSDDDRVRTVKVKTARGQYCRPVTKICLLEDHCN